ncbi:MAG: NADP-dependent oxidoreductase [Pseudomonadota bacterium]
MSNKRVLLKQRPSGQPAQADFEWVEQPLPEPGDGQLLIRNIYCSLDPAIRGWMDDAESYFPPIGIGEPIRCTTIAQVAKSNHSDFSEGDYVVALTGVEEYSVADAGGFTNRVDPSIVPALTNYLSVLGAVGLTAYFGLLDVGQPKPGETVLVSGAAGAVGSLVGQIAKLRGCRAVGIAGGQAKCERLVQDYGFDAAVDYRGKDLAALTADIAAACPGGVDVYFDNVGGGILDAALANINDNARIPMCGMISQYNATEPVPGPTNLWQLIAKTADMKGFLIRDFVPQFPQGIEQMAAWISEDKLVFKEHVDQGIENFLVSFNKLFSGDHNGKLVLQIAPETL